jgi:hypothetical protein
MHQNLAVLVGVQELRRGLLATIVDLRRRVYSILHTEQKGCWRAALIQSYRRRRQGHRPGATTDVNTYQTSRRLNAEL